MYSGINVFGGFYEFGGILGSLYFILFVILGNCIFVLVIFNIYVVLMVRKR